MKPRETLPSFVVLSVCAFCCSAFAVPPAISAPTEAAAALGKPAVVELDAVTLDLNFRGAATEGQFKAYQSRILDAQVWAGKQTSHADQTGFFLRAGGKQKAKKGAGRKQAAKAALVSTNVLVTLKPAGDAVLEVDTDAGKASIRLNDVGFDKATNYLDGELAVRRLPSPTQLAVSATDNDYPAAARGRDGRIWVAFVAYQSGGNPDMEAAAKYDFRSFVPTGNGDQIRLVMFDGRQWSAPLAVTEGLLDLWKPTVAVDGSGKVWVAWSQNVDGNWEIYRRRYDPAADQWSATERITTEPGSDINVVSTTDAKGRVWWAWQGRRSKHFQIFRTTSEAGAKPIAVTESPANHWDPAIAADSRGNVYLAWDSYENGNYDVFLQRFHDGGESEAVIPVAATPAFEARASLAVDRQDRVWIGYEQGGANWGKDFGRMVPGKEVGREGEGADGVGIPLYHARTVVVKCYADGRLQRPAADLAAALKDFARPKSFARLAVGDDGQLWLLFRNHPLPGGRGETWAEYAIPYNGEAWGRPRLLANSDNLLDNRPAAVPLGTDGVIAVYSSDSRLRGADHKGESARKPLKNDLYCTVLRTGGAVVAPQLAADSGPARTIRPVHPYESQDVLRLRAVRVESAGKTYQLARGEFHRHTEYTAHQDGDGSLEDMWRYSQDAADMDWMGNADHDNGWGQQYAWWIIQKTVAIFHNPPWFVAPFSYERGVIYPNGHRNVILAQRGIRTLPRGDTTSGDEQHGTPDTKMLYAYLRHFQGICASHTSGTGMGTDWRDNDPLVEPIVEIYQGARNNYECDGAPRGVLTSNARGKIDTGHEGIYPKGFIWNALAKGYKFGFESSSDHSSTHSSYGIALVEKPGREALIEAFKARRCFAATDNILLLVRSGDHLMGEEFVSAEKPTLEIHAVGTAPIIRLDIVRNQQYVYSAAPNKTTVDLKWTDGAPLAGTGYYYVRIEQADTNLAWSSPMWIHERPKQP